MKYLGRGRVIGRAGTSASSARAAALTRKALVEQYKQVSPRHLMVAAALVLTLVAAYQQSHHGAVALPMAVALLALVLGDLTVRFPSVVATTSVLAVFAAVASQVGTMYAIPATGGRTNGPAGHLTVVLIAALTGLLAHRTSRGRPWVTTLYAVAAVSLVGPPLLLLVPSGGYLLAYVVAGAVLFGRAGGIWWMLDGARRYSGVLGKPSGVTLGVRKPANAVKPLSQRKAEKATAALLNTLGTAFTVMHDLGIPGHDVNVDHLVIGPSGVWLVETVSASGVVREHPKRGLEINGVPVAQTLDEVMFRADQVSRELDGRAVQALVVVHGAVLPSARTRVALLNAAGEQVGEVVLLAPERLLSDVDVALNVLTPKDVTVVTRRARLRLVPLVTSGVKPKAAGAAALRREPSAQAAVVDADGGMGSLFSVSKDNMPLPLFRTPSVDMTVSVGQRVSLVTDQGMFSGFVVVSDQVEMAEDGSAAFLLCSAKEWDRSVVSGVTPEGVPYPAASVVST